MPRARLLLILTAALLLTACDPHGTGSQDSDIRFRMTGRVVSPLLDEISGVQVSGRHPGVLWVHNDDGKARIHALGGDGSDLGYFDIEDAKNRDWEDMTRIPRQQQDLLVLADFGDNSAKHKKITLYLVAEPDPDINGHFSGSYPLHHAITLTYPDGARDTESIAWDPEHERLLFLSKRDRPPQLYALDATTALQEQTATLELLGKINSFRPPEVSDRVLFTGRTAWVSQPTGMDISPDGSLAAVITYRSLYIFYKPPGMTWLEGLNQKPIEIIGPPGDGDEAVSISQDGNTVWVASEGKNSRLFEFQLSDE